MWRGKQSFQEVDRMDTNATDRFEVEIIVFRNGTQALNVDALRKGSIRLQSTVNTHTRSAKSAVQRNYLKFKTRCTRSLRNSRRARRNLLCTDR